MPTLALYVHRVGAGRQSRPCLAHTPGRGSQGQRDARGAFPTLHRRAPAPGTDLEYYGLAVDSMRAAGRRIDDEVLAHISPAHSENINFFGSIDVDIEGELAQLGHRPLRVRDTLF